MEALIEIWNINLFWEFTDGTRKIERFQWIKITFSSYFGAFKKANTHGLEHFKKSKHTH